MARFLRETDIQELVTAAEMVDAVEAVAAAQAAGEAWLEPRHRLRMPAGMLHTMSAAWPARGYFAHKAYAAVAGQIRFRVMLYELATGKIVGIHEGNRLGQLRTGAATAVAARRLLPAGAGEWALFGTGLQAWGQLEAMAAVARPERLRIYSRDAANREAFAARVREELGLPAEAAASPEACAANARVVITATTSKNPVFPGTELAAGAFVAAVGANLRVKRELDGKALRTIDRIVVDDLETAKRESGMLLTPMEAGFMQWNQIGELPGLVAGTVPARESDGETLCFHSLGSATWDLAASMLAQRKAEAAGIGEDLPLD